MQTVLKPQKGPQERFLATPADICIYGGSAGGGKAQPLDEPVLTPDGFVPMGSLKVGSVVKTPDGSCAKVMQIHPQGVVPVYKVTFIDGAQTRCTEQHLWKYHVAREREGWKVADTKHIINLLKTKHVLVPLADPVEMSKTELPIKPYTFGCLLGDGCLTSPTICISKDDQELFDMVEEDGYTLSKRNEDCLTYGLLGFMKEKAYLNSKGLLCTSSEKYIPDEYKYSSLEDRWKLVQGLMDTDGYADGRGHTEYCTTSERMAKDFQEIIWSLGGKATISTKKAHYRKDGEVVECKDAHVVYVQTKDNSKLFRLSRKKNRCVGKKYNGGVSELKRRIVSIEPCGEEECQCITLDNDEGLYITKDYIVTHNSYALLLAPLRYMNVKGFGCTIFRKNYNQVFSQGGLWDESEKIYGFLKNAKPRRNDGTWRFYDSNGNPTSSVKFAHIERDEDLRSWQGSQLAALFFDELTHFSEKTFFYMLSRNRSSCGVKPFVRATCNPDADSWVAKFIEWWIDQETGYPIPERSGKVRYFIRRDEKLYWASSREELWEQFDLQTPEEKAEPKSVTFISSSIYDNQELLKVNPQYLSNLKALSVVERERLLHGNWKIRPAAGLFFKRSQVGDFIQIIPNDVIQWVRCWDLAASEKDDKGDPAYTAGVLMGKRKNGRYIIADVINVRKSASDVRKIIKQTAQLDIAKYKRVRIRLPQDPGQAGKEQKESYIKMLSGFDVTAVLESGSKESRAEPLAAQWQAGNVDVVIADWNDSYLEQMEGFPVAKFKDMVDASANAFTEIELRTQFNLRNLI